MLRNAIFGVQDSLGSTCGFLSGVAVSGAEKRYILVSGVVLIFVEAFSMAVGTLISEHSIEEFNEKKSLNIFRSIRNSGVMFFSYFVAGFIPLVPYLIFDERIRLYISIVFSVLVLVLLAIVNSKLLGLKVVHHLIEIVVVGSIAIVAGVIIGGLVSVG